MNEQIKAIGRQAGFAFIEDGVYGQRWYSSKCGLDASEYEKLVGLIVKECTNMLPEDSVRNADGVHMFYVIREHFGVSAIGR
jgi:hypothetical protein